MNDQGLNYRGRQVCARKLGGGGRMPKKGLGVRKVLVLLLKELFNGSK
jgi:hypothetical protein